ncbi:DUF481 domain-containing protein [Aquimarina sp. AD10]|uniref:DUF481 domain-containing protein n=1 Tax=Aquimarina sp. AD10 TaxID=1714849 RepID=UPI000E516AE6|nr:DUF481 domain-containing protein [Aquimarina sp. AD10]AXT63029.1 DUF481 domain-containing protein [Aquimarina sp. AD10]RKM96830.1 DUF481 domain-containing protein [Aquimarina sp. AD10]
MKHSYSIKIISISLFILFSNLITAQIQNKDTIVSPFRKGKWLTGLSGTINSSTIELRNTNETTTTNEYGINLTTGKFIKNRFLVGGTISANRSNNSGIVERTTENLFLGPIVSYYLSKVERGSLFFQASPGYVLYRDNTRIEQTNGFIEELAEGGGFGTLLGVGYSYAFFDVVTFDIGLKTNLLWINIDQESTPINTITSEAIFVNSISFSFGFNILVDQF